MWTPEVLDALLDYIRPLVPYPVRPPIGHVGESLLVLPKQPATSSARKAAFTWAWLDLPVAWIDTAGAEVNVFPLPVACLEKPLLGSMHLVSLTAFYHVLPKPQGEQHKKHLPIANLLSFTLAAPLWDLMGRIGVNKSNLVHCNRAERAAKRATASVEVVSDEDEGALEEELHFNAFMGTPKMLLGLLTWLAHVKRQSRPMQSALFDAVRSLCLSLPSDMHCLGLEVRDRSLDGGCLALPGGRLTLPGLLREMQVESLWGSMENVFPNRPPLSSRSIGPPWLVWFAFRQCGRSN